MRAAHASACAHVAGAPGGDALEHEQLGAVQVRHDGHPGATRAAASCSGVRWCRCRTSAEAAPARSRARDHAATCSSKAASPTDAKTGSGASGRSSKDGCSGGVAGVEVDGDDVEARVEAAGVAAPAGQRAAHDRDVPAVRGQRVGQGAGDVRGAPAREEHEGTDHAHPTVIAPASRCGPAPRTPAAAPSARQEGQRGGDRPAAGEPAPSGSRGSLRSRPRQTSEVEPPPSRFSAWTAPSATSASASSPSVRPASSRPGRRRPRRAAPSRVSPAPRAGGARP